jgi:hypothetical protein
MKIIIGNMIFKQTWNNFCIIIITIRNIWINAKCI